jgi:hypothetical protein
LANNPNIFDLDPPEIYSHHLPFIIKRQELGDKKSFSKYIIDRTISHVKLMGPYVKKKKNYFN